MTNKEIDWNVIELTEIYESFDMVLRLLDEDLERARRVIDAAIKHGATPESMAEPIEEFAMELLKKEKVAVVPGTAFGECGEGFLRISYAYSVENLKVAIGKIKNFIDTLS